MTTRIRLAIIAWCALFVLPSMALAAQTLSLGKGQTIEATMNTSLDTKSAFVGQRFTMNVVPPYPRGYDDFDGAVIHGDVIKVTHANKGVNPEIQLAVTSITMRHGSTYPLDGQLTSIQQHKKLRNGATVAAYGLGGMLVGNAIGKTIFHTGIGGAVGAIAGGLAGYNQKSDFTVDSGTHTTVTLTHALVVRRQASRPY